jgi:hypothetical protein
MTYLNSLPPPFQIDWQKIEDSLVQCIVVLCITASIFKHAALFVYDLGRKVGMAYYGKPTADSLMAYTQRELMAMAGTSRKISKKALIAMILS